MRLTYWYPDQETYEVRIYDGDGIILRKDGEECLNNGVIVSSAKYFISGPMVDALAEYENTGLTPNEIKELQGDTFKKLKESNKILRKNNDEYYIAYLDYLDFNLIEPTFGIKKIEAVSEASYMFREIDEVKFEDILTYYKFIFIFIIFTYYSINSIFIISYSYCYLIIFFYIRN